MHILCMLCCAVSKEKTIEKKACPVRLLCKNFTSLATQRNGLNMAPHTVPCRATPPPQEKTKANRGGRKKPSVGAGLEKGARRYLKAHIPTHPHSTTKKSNKTKQGHTERERKSAVVVHITYTHKTFKITHGTQQGRNGRRSCFNGGEGSAIASINSAYGKK